MSINKKIIIKLFLLSVFSIYFANAEELKKIGKFKDWEAIVLIKENEKVCFAKSKPVLQSPKKVDREARLFVSFRPSNKIVDEVYKTVDENNPVQSEYIGALNEFIDDNDVIVCAAGSAPGDLHKLWRTKNSKGFHLEYGNSCMGYEIPGGLGVKMADTDREVYVICGDASYLMLPSDIITTIQEGYKITIILINNEGYASIGGLSNSVGGEGFGTHFKYRNPKTGQLDGDFLPVDLAKNAESLGAIVYKPKGIKEFSNALKKAKNNDTTTVVYVAPI